jgi:hypothetical protein
VGAAILVWRHVSGGIAATVEALGLILVILALTFPLVLKRPSVLWWRFSHALAAVNARIVLTLVFLVALVPMSLLWRIVGMDPLTRRRSQWRGWTPYPLRYRNRTHYQRMY